jgi:hypothetical protein
VGGNQHRPLSQPAAPRAASTLVVETIRRRSRAPRSGSAVDSRARREAVEPAGRLVAVRPAPRPAPSARAPACLPRCHVPPAPGGAPLSSGCSASCRVLWFGRSHQSANGPSDTGDAWENFAVRCCTMGRTISATCDDTAAWCGTADGYTNHRCRGDGCTAANVARNKEWRQRRRLEPTPNHVHGSDNGYRNYGCRCEDCKQANADSQYRWRQKIQQRERETL